MILSPALNDNVSIVVGCIQRGGGGGGVGGELGRELALHKTVVINVVWPSKYSSLSSFRDLIDSTLFIPFTERKCQQCSYRGNVMPGFPSERVRHA